MVSSAKVTRCQGREGAFPLPRLQVFSTSRREELWTHSTHDQSPYYFLHVHCLAYQDWQRAEMRRVELKVRHDESLDVRTSDAAGVEDSEPNT